MTARHAMTGLMALAIGFLMTAQLQAQEAKTTQPRQGGSKAQTGQTSNKAPYLGVAVESLQPALARQMPDLQGRGIIVAQVAKDSPAEKAGLKKYDIILNYDEHRILSPEQLVKLVQHDKAGRDAVLIVMTEGKQRKVNVTLGEHALVAMPPAHQHLSPLENMPSHMRHNNAFWEESFDSMTLTRLDKNRFKAEIAFRDDKGKIERKTFEGTRQEIHKAIESQKDLPHGERDQLLRALDLRPRFFEFGMPNSGRWSALWDFEDLEKLYNDSMNR